MTCRQGVEKTGRQWNDVRNPSLRWTVWNENENEAAMKMNSYRSVVSLAVVCFVLSLGQRVVAAPSPAAGLLVQAYATLEQADHDYKGHRVAAMKQIAAAARLVGVQVRGDGKGQIGRAHV